MPIFFAILCHLQVSAYKGRIFDATILSNQVDQNQVHPRLIGAAVSPPPVAMNSIISGCTTSDDCCNDIYNPLIESIKHIEQALTGRLVPDDPQSPWPITSLEASKRPAGSSVSPQGDFYSTIASFFCGDMRDLPNETWDWSDRVAGPFWMECPDGQKAEIYEASQRHLRKIHRIRGVFDEIVAGRHVPPSRRGLKARCVPIDMPEPLLLETVVCKDTRSTKMTSLLKNLVLKVKHTGSSSSSH